MVIREKKEKKTYWCMVSIMIVLALFLFQNYKLMQVVKQRDGLQMQLIDEQLGFNSYLDSVLVRLRKINKLNNK